MVAKALIDRLRLRIEALAPPPPPPKGEGPSAKEAFMRRIEAISARIHLAREEAEARGEQLPPLPTAEEVAERFEVEGYHRLAAALRGAAGRRSPPECRPSRS
jgi:hypothetical protein